MRNLTLGHTINITLMFFQLKLNESCAIVKKELKICVALVGGYYYMLWIQRITRFVLCVCPTSVIHSIEKK